MDLDAQRDILELFREINSSINASKSLEQKSKIRATQVIKKTSLDSANNVLNRLEREDTK